VPRIKQIGEHFKIEKYNSAVARVKGLIETDKRGPEKIEEIVKTINKGQKKT
jgi:hypothetical protein